MHSVFRNRLAALLLASAIALPAQAEDAGALRRALASAAARDWTAAEVDARRSGPIAADLVQWHRLRAGQGSWPEYRDFVARHPDWPGLELLRRRGERVMPPALPRAEAAAWFGGRRPETLAGITALTGGLTGASRTEALADFWINTTLEPAEETALLAAHGEALAPHHADRLRALLDTGEWAAAERMLELGLVQGPEADLARARIAVQAKRPGVDPLILALPQPQREDAGLAMDRFRWRVGAKQTDGARALMLERSNSAEALRDPSRWAGMRKDYARAALRAGDWALAERLAANHFLPAGGDAAELDWLAGYAALRAGDAAGAAAHFARLPEGEVGAITLSRTHYWRARAAEAAGDRAAAAAEYAKAARHQSAYYGQLAAERAGVPMDPALALPGRGIETLPDWRGSALMENGVFQAGVWLVAAGQPDQAQRFFLHLAETAPPDDIARMARLMLELHRPWHALRLAKAAAGRGVIYPAAYYPLTGLEGTELGLPPELVMSIARRESEFNHTVSSPVGARGLMQVMPETARQMAGVLGLPFDLARLTQDAAYNARLGGGYLTGLRDRFGPSSALVAAGYNAGPGRSVRWLRDFGDLRLSADEGGTDPVDWVEMIPFDETRNYVMRVTESLAIYRARIAGRTVPIQPTRDLTGDGFIPPPRVSPLVLTQSRRPTPVPETVRLAYAAVAAEEAEGLAATDAPAPGAPDGEAAARMSFVAPASPAVSPAPPAAPAATPGPALPHAPILLRLSRESYALPEPPAATATR